MRATTLIPLALVTLALSANAQAPSPPVTGEFSVQMFVGGTNRVTLSVYPPTTYATGEAIPDGTPVQIRVYQSTDGGANYRGPLTLLSGGQGFVGQGEFGSRTAPWITLTVGTHVDNQEPWIIYLAASAVVGGEESLATTSFLTFRYYPQLVRYASPADAGGSTASGLEGTWTLAPDGETLTLRRQGNRIEGSLSADGITLRVTGTVSGRTYRLVVTDPDGAMSVNMELTLSQDGRVVTGSLSSEGDSLPLRLEVRGRTLVPSP